MNREHYRCRICRKQTMRGLWNTFTYCVTCMGFTRREVMERGIRWRRKEAV